MFEEEAEDYKNHTRIKDENTYKGFPDERISELQDFEGNYIDISERIIKTFKDAAEFGYNKANEWHFVKDGDLPPEDTKVLVLMADKEICIAHFFCKNVWDKIGTVVAWKEIVLPQENE